MSKIVSLHAENVKRLRAVHIKPDRSLVQIRGRNAQGKSSVLDSIELALRGAGAIPSVPVREGEDKAFVELQLEGLTITRKIAASGRTTMEVRDASGKTLSSPQTLLNTLVAGLSFDPLEFKRLDKKERLKTLQKLVGLDFSKLNDERDVKYEQRTLVGREARRLEGELTGVPVHEDAPEREVSNAELLEQLRAANTEHLRARNLASDAGRAREASTRASDKARAARERAEELIAQAEAAEAEAVEATLRATQLEEESQAVLETAPDIEAIHQRIAEADALNAKVRDNARHADLTAKIEAERATYSALTARIDEIDADKVAQLAAAKYPLPNMSMTEDGVLLNELPFEQASGAEQLRASVAMGMALAPALKVLLVRDGSLLDEESLAIMAEMAEEWGGQVWLEQVANDRSGPGIIIEDGSVVESEEVAAE